MKGHQRQVSEELRRVKQLVDTSPYRFELLAKNNKKKIHQQSSAHTINMGKHFDFTKKTQIKGSPARYDNKNKTSRKKSIQKFVSNHRVTQRISLNHPVGVNHQSTLSTKSKIMKINSILCGSIAGTGKEMMTEVENKYQQYIALTKQWKGLSIFDEVDKLILTLVQNYVQTIQKVMEKVCQQVSEQMKKYQKHIFKLQEQNKKAKQQIQAYSNIEELMNPIKERLLDQYEKCQWSTFILNSLAQQTFDIEGFIKQLPLYRKWIAPVVKQEQMKKQREREILQLDLKIKNQDLTKPTLRSRSALINAEKSGRNHQEYI